MTNKALAKSFQRLAQLMEFWDENPFKIKSYNSAYITLRKLDTPLANLSAAEITDLKGIGSSIAKGITELLTTGELTAMQALQAKTPEGVQEMLNISGFGPKKIRQLWQELGTETLGELLYACEENRLVALKGFGEKTQADLKTKIRYLQQGFGKQLYPIAEHIANTTIAQMRKIEPHLFVRITGELRRRCPVIALLELLVVSEPDYFVAQLAPAAQLTVVAIHAEYIDCHTEQGANIRCWLCTKQNFGSKLFKTTGTRAFIEAFLKTTDKTDFTELPAEEDIFELANHPFVFPELRETAFYVAHEQPKVVDVSMLKGVLHVHTTYSDGLHTLKEMAEYAREEGFKYIGITDHSQAAFYANGLKPDRVREQWAEIDDLNTVLSPFRIYKGIECDILNDGSLDYDDDLLAQFDFVIASVHSNLRMDEAKATERILRAVANPHVSILGHPTGRLLLARPGYPIDHRAVINACAKNNVAIELNANPNRLDIDPIWISYAIAKGVKIAINPDAHSREGIQDLRFGVYAARRGALTYGACVNTMHRDEFERWIKRRKSSRL